MNLSEHATCFDCSDQEAKLLTADSHQICCLALYLVLLRGDGYAGRALCRDGGM